MAGQSPSMEHLVVVSKCNVHFTPSGLLIKDLAASDSNCTALMYLFTAMILDWGMTKSNSPKPQELSELAVLDK